MTVHLKAWSEKHPNLLLTACGREWGWYEHRTGYPSRNPPVPWEPVIRERLVATDVPGDVTCLVCLRDVP